jgi:hypothetical protein
LQSVRAAVLPRSLDSFEEMFWHFEQIIPYAPVLAVELDGTIDPSQWKTHLRAVQLRYPLLRAQIKKIPGSRPYFASTNGVEIPFLAVALEKRDQVETAMERELEIGFGNGSGALARLSLLYAAERAIIILAAHHAAFDGRTMMMIIEDLLRLASGKPLEPPFEGALDRRQLLELPPDGGYRSLLRSASLARSPVVKKFYVERVSLSEALTAAALSACKTREVNVRALLASAFAQAGRELNAEWRWRALNVASPIDLRPLLHLGTAPGLLIGRCSAVIPAANQSGTLWHTASALGHLLERASSIKDQRSQALNLRQSVKDERMPGEFVEAIQLAAPSPDIMISNYGRLPIQDDFGGFRIKTLSTGSIAGLGATQKFSAVTVRGKMGICLCTCQPIPGILQKTSEILASACSDSA